ncbi:MAG: hypothetical protein HY782_14475 [Chloroflexi bacterium]|nr:hypothetical protein [Chloroflexota bacterium]
MTHSSNDQLAALARKVVSAAAEKNRVVRALGGVAVHMTCPSFETHPALQRAVKDVDLVARRKDFDAAAEVFAGLGATLRAKESGQWKFDKGGIEIELAVPTFREYHRIDLGPRLALSSPTLPPADLLLIKLQRRDFVEKDLQDSIALLLDHDVAETEDGERINADYIAKLCARDWGLFTTVYDNTLALEKTLDKFLGAEEAQLVWQRIERIQGEMDRQPKSLGWMLNQIIKRPAQVPA